MSEDDRNLVTRRAALKALAAVSVCPVLSACEFVELRDVGELADATPFSLDDPALESLSNVGETACLQHGAQELVLVRVSDDEIVAFNGVCPHQGLPMGDCGGNVSPAHWDADQEAIVCAWHGSTFDTDGELIAPPTSDSGFDEPIQVFPVEFDPETGEGIVSSS